MTYQIGFIDDDSSDVESSTAASMGGDNPYVVEFFDLDQAVDEVFGRTLVVMDTVLSERELYLVPADDSTSFVVSRASDRF
jgi:hypothetical protein